MLHQPDGFLLFEHVHDISSVGKANFQQRTFSKQSVNKRSSMPLLFWFT